MLYLCNPQLQRSIMIPYRTGNSQISLHSSNRLALLLLAGSHYSRCVNQMPILSHLSPQGLKQLHYPQPPARSHCLASMLDVSVSPEERRCPSDAEHTRKGAQRQVRRSKHSTALDDTHFTCNGDSWLRISAQFQNSVKLGPPQHPLSI